MPEDGAALMRAAARRPDQCATRSAPAEETLSFAEYSAFFATPAASGAAGRCRRAGAPPSATRSSAPGRLDCGRFAIPGFRAGNIAVLIQPARGYNIDPKATYHDPALVPPHWLSRLLCLARRRVSAPTR